jgi:hypothetical protein
MSEMRSTANPFVVRCIILLISMSGIACNAVEIDSSWVDHRIAIDGVRGSDWDGVMLKINNQPVAIGFQNDSNYLYLLFSTYDQSLLRQLFWGGLTIWFDSGGGGDKIFGIHFPLMAGQRELLERPEMKEGDMLDEGDRLEKIPFNVTDMEITGPLEDKKERVNINQVKEIQAKISIANGNLIYELRVPFKGNESNPYFIGTQVGSTIGISIETADRSRERTTEFERRRGDAEELPAGLREGGAGMGDGGAPGGGVQTEPLSFRAKIKLAVK